MHIRLAEFRDLASLRRLYDATVRAIGPEAYSEEQVEAWAAFAEADTFPLFISTSTTFIATEDEVEEDAAATEYEAKILGFCGVSEDGHLASLYVRHDRCRQGIGSQLLARAKEYAVNLGITRLYTEASHFSRPMFAKHGFVDSGTEVVERNGVSFERFLMTLSLSNSA